MDQVQGWPFGRVLDQQKFAGAQLLRQKRCEFNIFIFRFERFFEGPERLPKTRRAAQEASREGLGKSIQSEWSPNGGSRVGRAPSDPPLFERLFKIQLPQMSS